MPSASKAKSRGNKKAYWLETSGELLSTTKLSNEDVYDHNAAYDLVDGWQNEKPVGRFKLYCVADGLKLSKASTFGSSPPRKMYLFKDIQRFYLFNDYPALLVLACTDPGKKTRNYDMFRLDQETVQDLCELIDKAHSHPLSILVDDGKGLVRYHSSHSSLGGDVEVQPDFVDNTEQLPDHDVDRSERRMSCGVKSPLVIKDRRSSVEQNSPIMYRNESPLTQRESPERVRKRSPIPKHLLGDPLFKDLCENLKEDDLWSVDMKYIDRHPAHGNQICSSGGVYIFVAHHKSTDYTSNNTVYGRRSDHSDDQSEGERQNPTAETDFTVAYTN